MNKVPTCPKCSSTRTWKDGTRQTENGKIQRYYCRECCYRFSETNSNNSNEPKPVQTIHRMALNMPSSLLFDRQICASQTTETKNLVKVETRTETRLAGATKLSKSELKGKIIEFLWWMKKQGYKESTIFSRGQRLKRFVNLNADLYDPERIKEIIATQDTWSDARKEGMVYTYDLFAQWAGLNWEKPHYKPVRKLPFIPQEREIDDLIAGSNKQISAFLQIGKETGTRAGEIFNLTWIDIDLQNKTINITPEKGSNPRIIKISNKLVSMLSSFLNKEIQIFTNYKSLNTLRRTFERYRQRTAHKRGNPRIQKITFHTLRHWKATTEYHQTKTSSTS